MRFRAREPQCSIEALEALSSYLPAIRVNYRVVRELKQLKLAMRDGLRWMNFAMRPFAILPGFELTRPKPKSTPPTV